MKCNRCGRDVDENSFCIYCGNNLKDNYRKKKEQLIQTKDNNNVQAIENNGDDEYVDNTLLVAGIVTLLELPFIIYGIIMTLHYSSKANSPSVEFFGPIPELIDASVNYFTVGVAILIPILIIIVGGLTGIFKRKKVKK